MVLKDLYLESVGLGIVLSFVCFMCMAAIVWTSSAPSSPGGCAALEEVTWVGRSRSAFCHLDKAADDFTWAW